MQKRKTLILCLATGLLTILPSKLSLAFSINRPWNYRYSVPYVDRQLGIWGRTRLDAWPVWDPRRTLYRGQVIEIKRGGTVGLHNLLGSLFPDWDFQETGNLQGSFDIQEYYACAPDYPVPIFGMCGGFRKSRIGAHFQLNYSPRPFSSDPQGDNVHWIQRVIASHFPGIDPSPLPIDIIDIPILQQDPYYDTVGDAGPTFFIDTPVNPNPHLEHYFYAETYLVEEIAPRKVKIYNGVRWGWENEIRPLQIVKSFSDSLGSGTEVDSFRVNELTPGAPYMAWINNSLSSNQCNPNTSLSASSQDNWLYDSNNSPEGDGFASGLWGTVPDNGTINLSVQAANGGARGEDEGNYELFVAMLDSEDVQQNVNPWDIISGGSGGGGIVTGGSGGGGIDISTPGRSQQNPLLPDSIDSQGWQSFNNVPGCRWYDPPIANTFEFVATDNTLFTEILDFPRGEDNLFTVVVEDMVLGEYSPGDRVDFVSLLGRGISNFKITDIDYLVGSTEETYFPIQLAFDKNVGSFKMRMVEEEEPPKKKVPESNSIWGLIALGAFGLWKIRAWKNRK